MPKIQFMHADDRQYLSLAEIIERDARSPEPRLDSGDFEDDELESLTGTYFPGGPDEPQLLEHRFGPNAVVRPHRHGEDEIVYVLEGEIIFGRRSFPAGSAILIPGHTHYGFHTGPDGLRFLNFRPRQDLTFISVEREPETAS